VTAGDSRKKQEGVKLMKSVAMAMAVLVAALLALGLSVGCGRT
jgi:hypothetical protein